MGTTTGPRVFARVPLRCPPPSGAPSPQPLLHDSLLTGPQDPTGPPTPGLAAQRGAGSPAASQVSWAGPPGQRHVGCLTTSTSPTSQAATIFPGLEGSQPKLLHTPSYSPDLPSPAQTGLRGWGADSHRYLPGKPRPGLLPRQDQWRLSPAPRGSRPSPPSPPAWPTDAREAGGGGSGEGQRVGEDFREGSGWV